MSCASHALEDMFKFFDQDGQAAIYDGTNCSKKTREMVTKLCDKYSKAIEIIWVESICKDKSLIQHYSQEICSASPDYVNLSAEDAEFDFKKETRSLPASV